MGIDAIGATPPIGVTSTGLLGDERDKSANNNGGKIAYINSVFNGYGQSSGNNGQAAVLG